MRLLSERLSTMPPGRHPLPRDFVSQHQRERILVAIEELVAERGYQGTTIELIAKTARVALVTFYEQFEDKEACFLAAFDAALEVAKEEIAKAVDPESPWPEQVVAGIRAALELVAREPARARLCLVEAQAAGPKALARYEGLLEAIAAELRRGREECGEPPNAPAHLEDATAGGLAWLVHHRLVAGEVERLRELLPEMVEIALTPYVGGDEARRLAAEAAEEVAAD